MSPLASLLSRGKEGQETDAAIDVADLVAPRTTLVARVNLLPSEIADAERFRREQIVRAGAVAASVIVVAFLSMGAAHQVSDAQRTVDATTARTAQLKAEQASLAEVPATQAALDASQAQRYGALGNEVRWSSYLNDLGLLSPSGTQVQTMSVVQTVDPPAVAAGQTAKPGVTSATGQPGIAAVTYSGIAKSNDSLAYFLEALAKQKGNVDPFFTSAVTNLDTASKKDVVTFNASVTVNDSAKSNRYAKSGS